MFTANRFLALAFLAILLVVTSATGFTQFGPSTQVYVITPEVGGDGSVALRVFTTQCTQNYQMFLSLSKRQDIGTGGWVDQPGLIPIGIEPLAPSFTVRRSLNLKLTSGTYKLSVTNLSRYGNADRNVDERKYCVSSLMNYAQTEDIIFTVGSNAEPVEGAPVVMAGDQYARMKDGSMRVGVFLPNASRLIVSQLRADGTVNYFIVDQPATPSDFQQISLDLPKNFDGSLPVEINIHDKSTGLGISRTVLERNPVVATSATTNR